MARVKGVLLCGGEGTRLRPFTEVINKHLVRVYDLPMAEYPLMKMIACGIKDIMIVSGGSNFAAVVKYFGSGQKWKVNIVHAIQDEAGGIAQALSLAENFVGDDNVLVCLGDNIWSMDLKTHLDGFKMMGTKKAMLFAIKVDEPQKYGVLAFDDGKDIDLSYPIDIIEKPKKPASDYILSGIYFYGPEVFAIIKGLKPSKRGELEITDVNRVYIKAAKALIVYMSGWWSDCGTLESLLKTEERIKNDRYVRSVCP